MFYLKFTIITARTHNKVLYASMAGRCMASFYLYSTVVQIYFQILVLTASRKRYLQLLPDFQI